PFSLPAGQSVASLSLSPDGRYVVANTIQPASGSKNVIVPNYVTESSYTEEITSRSKVGDAQSRTRMVVLDVETGESKWVDPGLKQMPQLLTQTPPTPETGAGAAGEAGAAAATSARPLENQLPNREVQLFNLQWSEDGKTAILLARAADNKDRWVLLL